MHETSAGQAKAQQHGEQFLGQKNFSTLHRFFIAISDCQTLNVWVFKHLLLRELPTLI